MIQIHVDGRPLQVPEGVTVVQALWHAGHELIRGIGCLGGVCGACTFNYKKEGELGPKSGLACQTLVSQGMSFSMPASIPQSRPSYSLNGQEDLQTAFFNTFPTSRRCVRCSACTMVCPQKIDVQGGVVRSLTGKFPEISEMFYNCIMCGLCEAVCDVSIQPNLIGLYARRLTGVRLLSIPGNLTSRVQEVESGHYEPIWKELSQKDEAAQVDFLTSLIGEKYCSESN